MRRAVLVLTAVLTVGALVSPGGATADTSDAFSATKSMERVFEEDGDRVVVDERTVTVKVDHTKNLRGRERVQVSWSGAHPSGGRATNPFGEKGLDQEYPVVVLQCRGRDDSSLPAARRLARETCWTSTPRQRSVQASERTALWRQDAFASAADREPKSGLSPFPSERCDDVERLSSRVTPFKAASGTVHLSCSATTMAPEAAADAAFPPAEVAAFTDVDGNGRVSFEVRTATENESLGCSSTTPCSLVVIPIMGISCADDASNECLKTGQFAPGSSNYSGEGVDAAVSPVYWWAESNWRNRISVPLTFATEPDVCDVKDSRAPTAFYGSELLSQASTQWAPAYCLKRDRFKFQHNRMADGAAFALMERGDAAAAFVSGGQEAASDTRVGYAPTAVTGFAVSYVIDRPDNAGELGELRLTPRLLAKLITQSYTGSTIGQQHPGMAKNPMSINQDPEFKALNPGLDSIAREAGAALLSLSEASDVVESITTYIASDPEAAAFVKGQADPWGMVVNPSYRAIKLPVDEWPLLDKFVPTSTQECRRQISTPYMTQLAAPISSLRKIAEAVLDGWPNVQTKCTRSSVSDPWKMGRVDRQGIGSRFMLGVVGLGDAARLDLRTASLQTKVTRGSGTAFTDASGRSFVEPTSSAVLAAVRTARRSEQPFGAFALGPATTGANAKAYPGAMIVYTAARLEGMAKADARKVAQFIRVSTTEGQRAGAANGQLPRGFVPITRNGATAALWKQADAVADAVESQTPSAADEDGEDETTPEKESPGGGAPAPPGAAPGADVPAAGPAVAPPNAPAATTTLETAPTAATTSSTGRLLMAGLLGVLLLAGFGAPAVRVVALVRGGRR
ncbi:hypothetical protein [Aeromicrobium sp. IC_218]|uniref:hypothetical protein n=1 Tax=Aeromicrobium sp. IC_218 TaxID=2545468 RepID=UPI00103D755D|nr:hypothetical protein [Aeromicrobium sp. IC_218]TCI97389.1 hypothetical protein E0W78_12515 [Aeromicrobium sp. IC_218]